MNTMKKQTSPAAKPMARAAKGLDEAGGWGDGDQSGNRSGDGAEGGGLAVVNPLGDGPSDGGSGGGKVGIDEGAGGQGSGVEGAGLR